MADYAKRVGENIPGPFFVDSTCIDCDACRQLAPQTFADAGETSYVFHQPDDPLQERAALHALVSCPTGSIGTVGRNAAKAIFDDFPLPVAGQVFYCGFNSPKSYGSNSYLICSPAGNWMVDAPKFLPQLTRRIEQMGGLTHIFLTHRDDVADAAQYAAHFNAQRIIHTKERRAQPDAEILLRGNEDQLLAPGFIAIPTPGHTSGHCVLLYQDRYLFTGDHVWWNRTAKRLGASQDHCWYSWEQQTESIARLLSYRFEWILPGHGQRIQLPPAQMKIELGCLVDRMRVRDR